MHNINMVNFYSRKRVCVCVCERERETERKKDNEFIFSSLMFLYVLVF